MQVLNSHQESKPGPELRTNHEAKASQSSQNKTHQNTETESAQNPAGKSEVEENQERMQSMNIDPVSDKKGKVSADTPSNSIQEKKKATTNSNDFTFACSHPDSPVTTADMLFHNGQIRPVYHADNVDSKKIVVEERNGGLAVEEPAGPYCAWSPEQAKKAAPTGNSKRWKLKDFVMRSRSEGDKRKSGENKGKKEKEGDKYLPQVGFITNVNGLSSNSNKVTKPI